MYKVDDMVMYGSFGICKVTAIEKRDLTGEEQEYYILKHINSEKNIFYVPTNNDKALSKMHRICSKAEVDELISHMNSEGLIWIDNDISAVVESTTTDGAEFTLPIDVANLSTGVHFLNVRAKTGTTWGTVYRYLFSIPTPANPATPPRSI